MIAAVLRENLTDLGGGAVFVVGEQFHQERHAAGTVAFVGDFLVGDAGEFAGAFLDGAVDVVGGHIHGARLHEIVRRRG